MTTADKIALKRWEEFHQALLRGTPTEEFPSEHLMEARRHKLEADPIAWIQYFFPQYAKAPFAPFHKKAIHRITQNPEGYEVLSWSRELAKSTTAMFAILYLTLTGRKKFVVLASATLDSAIRLLTPFRLNLEDNPRIRQFYGTQKNLGDWTEREFTTRAGAKFIALGAGNTPRGMRNQDLRPDLLYLDDFDTDEECRNPESLKKKWEWFEQALYPTRSISTPLMVLWCGNIIARDCCIVRAGERAAHWDIVNIRDKNGKSSWPQKNSEEQINRTLASISRKAQQAEYFNNPIAEGDIFPQLTWGKVPPLAHFPFLVAYGDPAYSDSKKKSASTKALWLVGKKGINYYVITGFLARETNSNFINWYYILRQYVGTTTTLYHYIENNKLQDPFFQQVFKPLLAQKNREQHTELHIRPDTAKKTDKATRIEANLEPLVTQGRLIFNQAEKNNPHMQELANQFALFAMHLPYPADGPDAIEGAIRIIHQKTIQNHPIYTLSYTHQTNPYTL